MGELTPILNKCEAKGLTEIAEELFIRYETMITGKEKPKYTIEESKEILQSLTPWEIDWED